MSAPAEIARGLMYATTLCPALPASRSASRIRVAESRRPPNVLISSWSGESHSCANRAQFFAIAARAMRRLLIDHARRRRAVKRGGDRRRLPLEDVNELSVDRDEYVVALDDALTELAELDPQLSRVIELRFFGGLNVEETALVIGVSPVTVKRRWRMAKGWLHREIVKGA